MFKSQQNGENTSMTFKNQLSKRAGFVAIFNGANSSSLTCENLIYIGISRYVSPQVLRYALRLAA